MHEMSLAGGVLRVVEQAAAREPFARVRRLTLEAGALAGVEVRALRFALEAIAPGTCLEGAEIEIDEPPGQAWCMRCATTVAVGQRGDACPQCGGYQLQPTGGTELKVRDLVVLDA
jgi:hydrogenase nickel incorporation protein HypA/HybF